jgi:hypothetical protein
MNDPRVTAAARIAASLAKRANKGFSELVRNASSFTAAARRLRWQCCNDEDIAGGAQENARAHVPSSE